MRGLPRASWGEEVSSPRVGLLLAESAREKFRPRHPHTTLCNMDYVVSLSLLDFCVLYNFGAHPLAMDATSGNARGGILAHLTRPPVRVCTKPRSQGREGCERGSLNIDYLSIFFKEILLFSISVSPDFILSITLSNSRSLTPETVSYCFDTEEILVPKVSNSSLNLLY